MKFYLFLILSILSVVVFFVWTFSTEGTYFAYFGFIWLFIAIFWAELAIETEKGKSLQRIIKNLFK